jgi:asparagine synthase (glutamine-hydrolysing)
VKTWLGERFRPLMESLLERRRIEREGLFEWPTIERLKLEHLSGAANHSHVLWSMMVFQAWRDRWLDGPVC